ncbi:hypothetical protein D9611_004884 [Ephemerocybe angulata]|uniref:Uncharacterized protein n=1 Tax=Ephemerocybe angulata TaxID=980116 RepID=A0A8H5B2U5_9AGAR|nr:hypothetical protein D9611_004884 [Tulosesus angulatus]
MPKADINKAGWEQSEFPILCETCLGSNPFVRMSKQEFGRSCGTCARPFTVFRWNPGEGARYKTTVICQTCAKVKNVCQTCLLDLEYGLPTQVRDTALGVTSDAPTSDINREYYAQNMESQMEGGKKTGQQLKGTSMAGKEMLKQLARTDPYYKRNRPNICSFFLKGDCNRGDACPYRHERPIAASSSSSDPNAPVTTIGAQQSIQDRYHGRSDGVAKRLLNSFADSAGLAPPADPTVTSIYLAHLPDSVDETAIRTAIAQTLPSLDPQNIKSVVVISKSHIAFANFKDRDSAELAAAAWAPGLEIHGKQVAVKWGRSKAKAAAAAGAS